MHLEKTATNANESPFQPYPAPDNAGKNNQTTPIRVSSVARSIRSDYFANDENFPNLGTEDVEGFVVEVLSYLELQPGIVQMKRGEMMVSP